MQGNGIRVRTMTIQTLLKSYGVPQYFGVLSIDAEGLSYQIVHGTCARSSCRVVYSMSLFAVAFDGGSLGSWRWGEGGETDMGVTFIAQICLRPSTDRTTSLPSGWAQSRQTSIANLRQTGAYFSPVNFTFVSVVLSEFRSLCLSEL